MLNPGNLSTLNTNLIDKKEMMEYARQHHLFEHKGGLSRLKSQGNMKQMVQNLKVDMMIPDLKAFAPHN